LETFDARLSVRGGSAAVNSYEANAIAIIGFHCPLLNPVEHLPVVSKYHNLLWRYLLRWCLVVAVLLLLVLLLLVALLLL
jgi:hypothetical protein